MNVLEVRELAISYQTSDSPPRPALSRVSLDIESGTALGLLGESGSGKSTLALSLLGLLPRSARVSSGSVRIQNRQMLGRPERELRALRGPIVSLIFQDPATSLNPVMRVIAQVEEGLLAHKQISRAQSRKEAAAALSDVGLNEPALQFAYPHQLSTGQRQRVVIAQALICRPALLIADEPTSALDTLTQAEVLHLLRDLRRRFGLSLLFITHDPSLLPGLADRVAVMYQGQIVEEAPCPRIFERPSHPYTEALLRAIPPLPNQSPRAGVASARHLPALPNPVAHSSAHGCSFAPRCAHRMTKCSESAPPQTSLEAGERVRCFRYEH